MANSNMSDFLTKDSFTRFGYQILIRNESSKTVLKKESIIKIIEFKDDGLVLDLPSKTCQKTHNLSVFFFKKTGTSIPVLKETGTPKDIYYEAIGKVVELETIDDDRVGVDIKFAQFDIYGWKNLVNQYIDYQASINLMIKKAQFGEEE